MTAGNFHDSTERLSLYVPKGTKALLESYRRKHGFRSLNETVIRILHSNLTTEISTDFS